MGTKEDQDKENTQTVDTDMPELISSNEENAPQKNIHNKETIIEKVTRQIIIHFYLPSAMTV